MHLIGFQLRASMCESKSARKYPGVMSLQTSKSVYAAGKQQYTAACGEAQVTWGSHQE